MYCSKTGKKRSQVQPPHPPKKKEKEKIMIGCRVRGTGFIEV